MGPELVPIDRELGTEPIIWSVKESGRRQQETGSIEEAQEKNEAGRAFE